MAAAFAITRQDESAAELRRLALARRDMAQAHRHRVDDGRRLAHRRRDGVHRFNADGPAGLVDRLRSCRPGRLSADQLQASDAVVEAGPDLEAGGIVRWRCADLQGVIADKHDVALSERSVGRMLNERGFRHVSMRPQHSRSEAAAQDLF